MKKTILVVSIILNVAMIVFWVVERRAAESNMQLAKISEEAAIECQAIAEKQAKMAEYARAMADSAAMVAAIQRDSVEVLRQRLRNKD